VENGYTVPAVETLEKFARALEIPMYQLFYDGDEPPKPLAFLKRKPTNGKSWGRSGKDATMLAEFRRLFARMKNRDRGFVILTSQKMVKRKAG